MKGAYFGMSLIGQVTIVLTQTKTVHEAVERFGCYPGVSFFLFVDDIAMRCLLPSGRTSATR